MDSSDALLLSSLSYNGVFNESVFEERYSWREDDLQGYLKKECEKLSSADVPKGTDESLVSPIHDAPTLVPDEVWDYSGSGPADSIIGQACTSDSLSGFRIEDVSTNPYDEGSMITLVNDETREVAVVYEGTCGKRGWVEDIIAACVPMTSSQRAAVEYAQGVCDRYAGTGYSVISTGHSKGGQEAALVALMCDGISECYAYDAPGNSYAFYQQYGDQALENGHKVTYYNNEEDPISSMLIPVPGATTYLVTSDFDKWSGGGLEGFLTVSAASHALYLLYNSEMLSGEGGLWLGSDEAPYKSKIEELTLYLMRNLPSDDCSYLFGYLDEPMGYLLGRDDEKNAPLALWLLLSDVNGLGILLAALESYPGTDEFFLSLLDEAGLGDELYAALSSSYLQGGLLMVLRRIALTNPSLSFVLDLLAAYGSSIEVCKLAAMKRISAYNPAPAEAGTLAGIASAGLTHNFSEQHLAEVERALREIVALCEVSPPGQQVRSRRFSLNDVATDTVTAFSDCSQECERICERVRRRFERAWERDGKAAGELAQVSSAVSQCGPALAGGV